MKRRYGSCEEGTRGTLLSFLFHVFLFFPLAVPFCPGFPIQTK